MVIDWMFGQSYGARSVWLMRTRTEHERTEVGFFASFHF